MSVADTIFTALRGLVSDRCYPKRFPQQKDAVWPAIRFTIVGGTTYEDLCGDGDEDSDDTRVQIDWAHITSDDCEALGRQIRAAMAAIADPPMRMQAPPDLDWDADAKVYRGRADWMAHPSSS
jgi:hypothetical protein